MKQRSPSAGEPHEEETHRIDPPAAAPSGSRAAMEHETLSVPRELTQNPLKKIWMPCKNGLPEKHISQRKGTLAAAVPAKTAPSYGGVMLIPLGVLAAVAMVCWFAVRWAGGGVVCGCGGCWFTGFGSLTATIA